ncbi:MAG TPA: hypothetical protein VN258_11340 [Mobilitalea sp.]|nr:hypothetical protein [Mobilitalea sp.]
MQTEITLNKKYSMAANAALLVWFFLDMVGIYFDNEYLVTRSWRDDGIYFVIFLIAFLTYIFKEQIGKYILSVWLSIWLITQFLSHEWFTIVGNGQRKIEYFKNALKWTECETRYIPDVYHTILHILILLALITSLIYVIKQRMKKS